MATFGELYKSVYNRAWGLIDTDASLDFFKTKQKSFFPKQDDLLHVNLYPWIFMADGGTDPVDIWRTPRVWRAEFTILIVYLTHARLFQTDDLVFSDDANVNGIGDIRILLESLFWGGRKVQDFGVPGINDWNIGRTGPPTVLNVQRIAMSEFIASQQMELVFKVNKRDS